MAATKRPAMLARKKRVVVVDPHPIFRHGLTQLINRQADVTVCGTADDATTARAIIAETKPDLAVVDLRLTQSLGLDFIKQLKQKFPTLPVLVLSMHEEALYTEQALRAGAQGYIMKDESGEEILVAIRRVLSGKIYLSPAMGTKLLPPLACGVDFSKSPIDRLSHREFEVFQLLGKAYETRQIAQTLGVSVKTIETYREHLKIKLNLDNSSQLIRRAVEWVHRVGMRYGRR